jgi:hypothetical protein
MHCNEHHRKDLLDKCKKFKEHQGNEITPKYPILMLLQLAVDRVSYYGGKRYKITNKKQLIDFLKVRIGECFRKY